VTWYEGIFIFIIATAAILVFTAGTQGYFFARSTALESVALILAAFTLFRPGFWMDIVAEPYTHLPATEVVKTLEEYKPGTQIRLHVDGEDDFGDKKSFLAVLDMPKGETFEDRIAAAGFQLYSSDAGLEVDTVDIGSPAAAAGLDAFQFITGIERQLQVPDRFI
jgi:hypothetical protein